MSNLWSFVDYTYYVNDYRHESFSNHPWPKLCNQAFLKQFVMMLVLACEILLNFDSTGDEVQTGVRLNLTKSAALPDNQTKMRFSRKCKVSRDQIYA